MKKIIGIFIGLFFAAATFAQADSSIKPVGLKIGDLAPQFVGKDQNGQNVNLKQLLKKGDVVVVFYRGQWCPYCNKQLSKINDSLPQIVAKGATVITITPETGDNIKKTVAKTKATFAIIEDKGLAIMKKYKVSFAVDENTITKYKKYGIDFEKANGENGANLPVPATYIIGKNGKIKYAFFNEDYSKRATVKDILANL
jgi:peroxiredoxin